MKEVKFLTLVEVIDIHNNQIGLYGGKAGIREFKLLLSAINMPKVTFSGQFLHTDLFEMASAYIYHICRDHPFFDGNKRTALVCGLVFLEMNGKAINDPESKLYDAMIGLAGGKIKKKEISELLAILCSKGKKAN